MIYLAGVYWEFLLLAIAVGIGIGWWSEGARLGEPKAEAAPGPEASP